jgi:hypothetical protein
MPAQELVWSWAFLEGLQGIYTAGDGKYFLAKIFRFFHRPAEVFIRILIELDRRRKEKE